jgi:hypothetical protein
VRIEAPAGVSLFTYDNGAYVIQSFRDTATTVKVVQHRAAGGTRPAAETVPGGGEDTVSDVVIPPHSFRVFKG